MQVEIVVAAISAAGVVIAAVLARRSKTNKVYVPVVAPSDLEIELAMHKIVLSRVDVAQVRFWLQSDDAFQALARHCLMVLAGLEMKRNLPLDVIHGRYKQLCGFMHNEVIPLTLYGNDERLKSAIALACKEQHPALQAESFERTVQRRSAKR